MEVLNAIIYLIFLLVFLPLAIVGISYLFQIIEIGKKDKIKLLVIDKEDTKQFLLFKNITLDKAIFLKSVFENNGKECHITIVSQDKKTKKQKKSQEQIKEEQENGTTKN